jgi:GlpG protein
MMLLLVVGPTQEEKYGSANVVFVMLATAIATAVVNMVFFPNVALLGASGIVFAMILLSSITSTDGHTIPLTFILVAVLYIGQQIYEGIFVADNISQLGHIVGGLVGTALGFVMSRGQMSRYQR